MQLPTVTVPQSSGDTTAPSLPTVDVGPTVDSVTAPVQEVVSGVTQPVAGRHRHPAPVTATGTAQYARAVPDRAAFVESLMETHLYSVGAYFVDSNPDLADDVVAQAAAIEHIGLERYAQSEAIELEAAFQTLVTGLAVRYYRAVNGRPA